MGIAGTQPTPPGGFPDPSGNPGLPSVEPPRGAQKRPRAQDRAGGSISLAILPVLLGIFILGLNVFVAIWLWWSTFRLNWTLVIKGGFPTLIFLSLIIISLFIGLFLILYAIVLRRDERTTGESINKDESGHAPSYVRWVIVPVLIALPAPAITVWASQMVQPIAPKPCIELYQTAVNIKKDEPSFEMWGWDPDELRCRINQNLLTQ